MPATGRRRDLVLRRTPPQVLSLPPQAFAIRSASLVAAFVSLPRPRPRNRSPAAGCPSPWRARTPRAPWSAPASTWRLPSRSRAGTRCSPGRGQPFGRSSGSAGSVPASSSSPSRKPSPSRSMPMRIAGARRHAGVGELLPGRVGERAQRELGDRRRRASVGLRTGRRRRRGSPRSSPAEVPFATRSHSPASARAISSVDARIGRRAPLVLVSVICWPTIGARLRVEREHERLDLRGAAGRPARRSGSRRDWKPTLVEDRSRCGSGRACRRCRRAGSRSRGPGRP